MAQHSRACSILFLIFLSVVLSACQIFWWSTSATFSPEPSHAQRAQDLRIAGKYLDAIEEYRKHIAEREKVRTRAKDENPNFYEIYINDCYRDLGMPEEAEAAIERAYKAKVDSALIVDRAKTLAQWYEQQNEFQKALTLLTKYRDLDDLTMDADIDRIHRKSVAYEDSHP